MSRDATEAGRSVDAQAEASNYGPSDAADNLKTGHLMSVYNQLCDSYRAIDDIRMKLLGLLPIATGAGILVLTGGGKSTPARGLSLPIGLFGLIVTIGLFSYELHGIKKCGYWIDAGRLIEKRLGIYGQFQRRPHELAGFIDEPFAASIIYPAVLASWLFFALLDAPRWVGYVSSAVVFVGVVWISLHLIRAFEEDMKKGKRKQYCKEPVYFRRDFFRGLCDDCPPDDCPPLPLPDDAYFPPEVDAGQRPGVTSEKSAEVPSR
jgi:hypothetical protein